MGRRCSFPNCNNKQKTWSAISFHKLPLIDPERCKLWLRNLKIDPKTSRKTLQRRCILVCSDHFSPEDLVQHEGCTCLTPTAVPFTAQTADQTTGRGANDTELPIQGNTESKDDFPVEINTEFEETAVAGLSQSTPVKERGFHESPRRKKPRDSNFLLPRPRMKFSLSAPSKSEDSDDVGAYTNTVGLDDSMSSAEKTADTADSSFVPFTRPSTSSQGSSCDAAAGGCIERKWIVSESKLFELFQNCPQCGDPIEEHINGWGRQINIKWSCLSEHRGTWQSCSDLREMPENNRLTSACVLFSGECNI